MASLPNPANGYVTFEINLTLLLTESDGFLVSVTNGPTKFAVQLTLLPFASSPKPDQLFPTTAPPKRMVSAMRPFFSGKLIFTIALAMVIFAVKVSVPIIEADKSFFTSTAYVVVAPLLFTTKLYLPA